MPQWRHKSNNIKPATCEQLLKGLDFIGGTFVEYDRHEDVEYRGTITKFICKNNAFKIDTDKSESTTNFLKLGTPHITSTNSTIINQNNGIWIIDSGPWLGWEFAIAAKGVEIPTRRGVVK